MPRYQADRPSGCSDELPVDPPVASASDSSWTTLSMDALFRTGAPTPALIRLAMGFRSSSGRCVPSRHLAEGHPQVLIIALRVKHQVGRECQASAGTGQRQAALV